MIVLDTHVWLWWVSKPSELSRAAGVTIGAETRIGVSAISCLEVATAVTKGRITLDRDSLTWLEQALMGASASVLLTADGCIKWLYSNTAPHLLVILPAELYPYPQLVWLWLAPKVPEA